MQKMMHFTTSWDDGCALDLKIAAILTDAGCMGTFYVCPRPDRSESLLSDHEIRNLAIQHEIGAHTLTHPHLPLLSPFDARREIEGSKQWVEERTGKPCTMFCYPYGEENIIAQTLVRDAGFMGARTTQDFLFSSADPYALGTSLHLYPYPLRPVWNRRCLAPLRHAWPYLKHLTVPMHARFRWQAMARAVFLGARERGEPWFHLWGHSWEVETYRLWDDLKEFLAFVRTFPDVRPVPNSSLLPHAHSSAQ